MNQRKRTILSFAGVVFGLMMVFPPYWVMYEQPEENLHSGAGRHPIWNPPTPAYAFEALHGYSHLDSIASDTDEERASIADSRLASSLVGFNKVNFVFDAVVLVILTAGALLIFGRQPKSQESA
jgi:hypothetical protein